MYGRVVLSASSFLRLWLYFPKSLTLIRASSTIWPWGGEGSEEIAHAFVPMKPLVELGCNARTYSVFVARITERIISLDNDATCIDALARRR